MQPVPSKSTTRVAIIGTGVSGLATLKSLNEAGLDAVAFDRREGVGGLWNFTPETGHTTPAYPGLSMNTLRHISGFSDFPYPPHENPYPPRDEVLAYIQAYAGAFDLEPQVYHNTHVQEAVQTTDGRWHLRYHAGVEEHTETFDALVVCTGRHGYPNLPDFPDISEFNGQRVHSMSFVDPEVYSGQRVLLIGSGASAADLAVQISGVARRVTVSVKQGRWIVPRFIRETPVDFMLTRLTQRLPSSVLRLVLFREFQRELRRLGFRRGGREYGLPAPRFDLRAIRLTLNTEFLLAAQQGRIAIKPEIATFTPTGVRFVDGSLEMLDTVISATGYRVQFPFLPHLNLQTSIQDFDLYQYVFPPEVENLAFVGMMNVQGPFLPVYEMQARWVAAVLSGSCDLPSSSQMRRSVDQRQEYLRETRKRPAIVPYFDYMETLAEFIGVRPRLWRHPDLWRELWLQPLTSTQYRLDGPYSWLGAREALKRFRMNPHAG